MFSEIKTTSDVQTFLEKTNYLHDGYIIDVRYTHMGISKTESGHYVEPYKTKLILQILVTSMWDAVVEIEYNRDSNKVDKGLYDLIMQETVVNTKVSSVKLLANAWEGDASPYSQVVSIPGVTENSIVDLTPSVEQLAVFHNKDLAFVTENVGGVVTVYAIGQIPTNDDTIPVAITEVKA